MPTTKRQYVNHVLVVLLVLLLLTVTTSFPIIPSFGGRYSRPSTKTVRMPQQQQQQQQQQSLTTTTTSITTTTEQDEMTAAKQSLPNWRVISKVALDKMNNGVDSGESELDSSLLDQRSEWNAQVLTCALDWYHQLLECSDTYISNEIEEALKLLNDAYRLYGPTFGVICSFNGGKDACVILELVRAAHAKYYHDLQQQQQRGYVFVPRPRVVYWDKKGEFPQVLEFVQDSVHRYDLDMIAFERGIHFTQGLAFLVNDNKTPLAFVLGTRTSDPNAAGQGAWAPSSSSFMPPFMRVNPILHWNYGHVWQFLRSFQLPVCSLYQLGYTSLGTTDDTAQNPALLVPSMDRYRPAWMLTDYDQERAGRINNHNLHKKTTTTTTTSNAAAPSSNNSSATNLSTMSKTKTRPDLATTTAAVDRVPNEIHPKSNTTSRPLLLDYMESDVSFGGDSVTQRTVGLLIIGDEILKGYTVDTNSQAAAKALRQANVLLNRVVVVSDDMDEIAEEIGRMQHQVDVIITSGGVGPTHDDVTIKSVAAAFGDEMVLHDEMAQLLRNKMGTAQNDELTEAQIKMATLPSRSKLRYLANDDANAWPVLQCRNVFILPGVPEFFATKIEQVASYLSCQLERSTGYKVVLSVEENAIVSYLNLVVKRHEKHVTFGSYPFVNQPDRKTVITVEGKLSPTAGNGRNSAVLDRASIETSKEAMDRYVQEALDDLIATLPEDCVVRVDVDNMLLFH